MKIKLDENLPARWLESSLNSDMKQTRSPKKGWRDVRIQKSGQPHRQPEVFSSPRTSTSPISAASPQAPTMACCSCASEFPAVKHW